MKINDAGYIFDISTKIELQKLKQEIGKRDKVINIILMYVDKKHHKEIKKKLDEMGWYNKDGNDSIN
tara:strand:- start:529 stop:729 length:201 start_codon:yes stop_codon:yes gene_type:complete